MASLLERWLEYYLHKALNDFSLILFFETIAYLYILSYVDLGNFLILLNLGLKLFIPLAGPLYLVALSNFLRGDIITREN